MKDDARISESGQAFLSQLTAVAGDTERLIEMLLGDAPISGERIRSRRLLDAMRYASLNGGKTHGALQR